MKTFKRSIALGLILILSLTLLVACSGGVSGKYYPVGHEDEGYMEFLSGGKCKIVTSLGEGVDDITTEGTYKVSGQKLTIATDGVDAEGTIDGNEITFLGVTYRKG